MKMAYYDMEDIRHENKMRKIRYSAPCEYRRSDGSGFCKHPTFEGISFNYCTRVGDCPIGRKLVEIRLSEKCPAVCDIVCYSPSQRVTNDGTKYNVFNCPEHGTFSKDSDVK